tara:strand:- start:270 stop:434 length:165 start_codon:yes stop_codon:yes gene_type:complete
MKNIKVEALMTTEEKIKEAIKILSLYDRNCKISMNYAMGAAKKFLKENFNLEEK